jgi:hypothetical protein
MREEIPDICNLLTGEFSILGWVENTYPIMEISSVSRLQMFGLSSLIVW